MPADFSRVRHDPLLDYSGVELKQGAVLVDADFNEAAAIKNRQFAALASDVLGRARVSSTTPDAFRLRISATGGSLSIDPGRLYVDGLLAENHGAARGTPAFDDLLAEPRYTAPIELGAQPYLFDPQALPNSGRHLVYLEVWQREVTHVEQPALVETAVGVESSSRRQNVWQVKVLAAGAGNATCSTPDADIPEWAGLIAPSTGVLTTGTFDVPPADDPCELPPTGGYRGLENQLYRVEIQRGGPLGQATFKWSRENACVASRVLSILSPTELELETLGRDGVLGLKAGDWVEILDAGSEFGGVAGEMRKLTSVDPGTRHVTFAGALPGPMLTNQFSKRDLRVRRWDQAGQVFRLDASENPVPHTNLDTDPTGVIAIPSDGSRILLEHGVTVSFANTGAKGFKPGDYWVFAARTSDSSVERLERAHPRGIHRHYARLGIWDIGAGTVTDCRQPWPPATGDGHDCACTVCVTPSSHADGNGSLTIQEAVNRVQTAGGGVVCLAPGAYALKDPVRLINAASIKIHGQGRSTTLTGGAGIFVVRDAVAVAIEELSLVPLGRACAVSVRGAIGLALECLQIDGSKLAERAGAAISLTGAIADLRIADNFIAAPTGIRANDPLAAPRTPEPGPPDTLMWGAVSIENNLFICALQALEVGGQVTTAGEVRISDNRVVGCRDVAIGAVGLGAPGSVLSIHRNDVRVAGPGIRAGGSSLSIADNQLASTNSVDEAAKLGHAGITVVPSQHAKSVDSCEVSSNRVISFGTGMNLGAVIELAVRQNYVSACQNGILQKGAGALGSVTIDGNHLTAIGNIDLGTDGVFGISVISAETCTISHNSVRNFGKTDRASLRAAIAVFDTRRIRIDGNQVSDVAGAGFAGQAVGILFLAPYQDFVVTNNQIQRDPRDTGTDVSGNWLALVATVRELQPSVSNVPDFPFATLRVDTRRLLVFNADVISTGVFTEAVPVGSVAAPGARGSILGNSFVARGQARAVDVSAPGECLFGDNRVELVGEVAEAVLLSTNGAAILNANRVRGGRQSVRIATSQLVIALGNVTTAPIFVGGSPLGDPWKALNITNA